MERKVVVVCSIVGLLGLLSAAIGFFVEGEAMRITDSEVPVGSSIYYCAYPPSLLGLTAALALLISQIVLNVSAGCICWTKSPRFPDSNWRVSLFNFMLSWFTFVIAILLFLLIGFNCYVMGAGVCAGVLALANSAFGIFYYLTLRAAGKNGGDSSYPTLEGIAMGQPQIPQISQDPVFVHEDTYNRRDRSHD